MPYIWRPIDSEKLYQEREKYIERRLQEDWVVIGKVEACEEIFGKWTRGYERFRITLERGRVWQSTLQKLLDAGFSSDFLKKDGHSG